MLRIAASRMGELASVSSTERFFFICKNKNRQHRGKEEKAVLPVYENSKHLRLSGGFW